MPPKITITPATGTWVVRAGGAVLGESKNALELSEGDYPAVIYFPRSDIATAFLDPSERTSNCPHKGDASYYSIVTKSKTIENAVWSYEAPLATVDKIKGYLAFYPSSDVAVERV
ncbi:DUF427 domain-containing protein [Lentibacter sp. XHP0401]|jgi:uncharacterized protein (DUF427 family)|uniref:DUF427 domain-containing protein n=1 Tax=Lentibacter sp. XHP0401 TaxID=2984334 RepID=UPI0021E73927|nr:DUF427 domain-containing protein [Lentibacter sp. XHP0401]MCV2891647.1 DUF427 domain-containing protein [Lentibacter sp. XHP0401]